MKCVFCDRPRRWMVQEDETTNPMKLNVCGRHLHTAVEICAGITAPAIVYRMEDQLSLIHI